MIKLSIPGISGSMGQDFHIKKFLLPKSGIELVGSSVWSPFASPFPLTPLLLLWLLWLLLLLLLFTLGGGGGGGGLILLLLDVELTTTEVALGPPCTRIIWPFCCCCCLAANCCWLLTTCWAVITTVSPRPEGPDWCCWCPLWWPLCCWPLWWWTVTWCAAGMTWGWGTGAPFEVPGSVFTSCWVTVVRGHQLWRTLIAALRMTSSCCWSSGLLFVLLVLLVVVSEVGTAWAATFATFQPRNERVSPSAGKIQKIRKFFKQPTQHTSSWIALSKIFLYIYKNLCRCVVVV